MKYMIASDLHGSDYYCDKMLEAFDKEGADRLILLGDILYHGPRNDLPKDYNTKKIIPKLNARKHQLFCVRGNCEAEVDQMVLEFPVLADYALLEQKGHMIFITHGHLYNEIQPPLLQPGDVLLHGHTHVQVCRPMGNGCMYLNPGSLSLPKENSAHGYMTLEDGVFTWKDVEDGHELQVYSL